MKLGLVGQMYSQITFVGEGRGKKGKKREKSFQGQGSLGNAWARVVDTPQKKALKELWHHYLRPLFKKKWLHVRGNIT